MGSWHIQHGALMALSLSMGEPWFPKHSMISVEDSQLTIMPLGSLRLGGAGMPSALSVAPAMGPPMVP